MTTWKWRGADYLYGGNSDDSFLDGGNWDQFTAPTLSAGNTAILQPLYSYPGGWTVAASISGAFSNAGVITILPSGGHNFHLRVTGDLTLSGGGAINLGFDPNSSDDNYFNYNLDGRNRGSLVTFENVDNIIRGAIEAVFNGNIVNDAKGVWNASSSIDSQIVAFAEHGGFTEIVNKGLIETTGPGRLTLSGFIDQTGGGRIVASGGDIDLTNSTVVNGTLRSTGASKFVSGGLGLRGAVTLATGTTLVADVLTIDDIYGPDDAVTINNLGAITLRVRSTAMATSFSRAAACSTWSA